MSRTRTPRIAAHPRRAPGRPVLRLRAVPAGRDGRPHTPIGVFRQVERPSYDALMAQQVREAQTKQGEGDLAALLAGGDTWTIR